jgi:hypothetical protein
MALALIDSSSARVGGLLTSENVPITCAATVFQFTRSSMSPVSAEIATQSAYSRKAIVATSLVFMAPPRPSEVDPVFWTSGLSGISGLLFFEGSRSHVEANAKES